MYFWNIEGLKKDHIEGTFTDKNVLPYILVYVGLGAFFGELMHYITYEEVNVWSYILSGLNVLIVVAGTLYAYQSNGGSQGDNFAAKYFSISFVVAIRMMLLLIPITVILILYWAAVFGDQEDIPTTLLEVVLFAFWLSLIYFKTAKHIGETSASN